MLSELKLDERYRPAGVIYQSVRSTFSKAVDAMSCATVSSIHTPPITTPLGRCDNYARRISH
jgi:hypothetical protein